MSEELLGRAHELAAVVVKAALMYLVALVGLRLAHRRTLAQWTAIDFAAAVAIGAVMGGTAVAEGRSVLAGATALVTLLAAHWAVTMGRFHGLLTGVVDHRVRVLVDHGRLRPDQMRVCGLTDNDVLAKLRERGVGDLSELRYVLYETKGELTIVREPGREVPDSPLVRAGLQAAAAWPPSATGTPSG